MQQVALVTGGGRGIGQGISLALVAAGYQVVVVQRSSLPDDLQNHEHIDFIAADLGVGAEFEDVVKCVSERYGRLDLLVNNAGVMLQQSMGNIVRADWDLLMALNVSTPVFLTQALLPMLVASQGNVIHIGSIEGLAANPDHVAYCASKGAIHSMTKAMAIDLGPQGVRCNAIAPGWIRSQLSDDYINGQANVAQAWQGLLNMHPVGRVGEPQDIGQAVVFLASDQASFISGQVLVVDGARTSKLPLSF
ncbi:MAG TPA: short-chain dehydrogenase [Oceanospirillaceae bacterium]|nr:short-chain dehydrogenase [Oceanospirillaceae bacterium]